MSEEDLVVHTFQAEVMSGEDFWVHLREIVTNPSVAEEGDVVAIGFPLTLTKDGQNVEFDRRFPNLEVGVQRGGGLVVGSDDDLGPQKFSHLMKLFGRLRQDVWRMKNGSMAALRLARKLASEEGLAEVPGHMGIIVWVTRSGGAAMSWTHGYRQAEAVFADLNREPISDEALKRIVRDCLGNCAITWKTLLAHRGVREN